MYDFEVIIQGFPGKALHHGGLGWSTVSLLRSKDEVILIDTGSYAYRDPLLQGLGRLGLRREDVTSLVLTHCHWDHICNYPMFPKSKIFVPGADLEWALHQPIGTWHIPEFHVERLGEDARVIRVADGDEFLPGLRAVATPGHTPGHLAYVAQSEKADLIFAGDAVKNQAELVSEQVDMTLDLPSSLESIRLLRKLAARDPSNVMVCGHERLLSFDGTRVKQLSELYGGIAARLTSEFEEETLVDLTRP